MTMQWKVQNGIVPSKSKRENLGFSNPSESRTIITKIMMTATMTIMSVMGRVWKRHNVTEFPCGFTGDKAVVLQK